MSSSHQPAGPQADLRRREEEYYKKFWESEDWGTREPNVDERARSEAVIKVITDFVLPERAAGGALRILDLGCGRGWLTDILGRYGAAKGIDPVSAAIDRARELFPQLDFQNCDAASLLNAGGDQCYDLVVSSEVIEHVLDEHKQAFVRSIHALLAPGGFAILTTPRGEVWEEWRRLGPGGQPVEQWISEPDLDHLCLSVGFTIRARERVFVPWCAYNLRGRLLSSRRINRLASRLLPPGVLRNLHHGCAIYQVILLQRL